MDFDEFIYTCCYLELIKKDSGTRVDLVVAIKELWATVVPGVSASGADNAVWKAITKAKGQYIVVL